VNNPNWKKDFWGVHYDKLSEIKSKWDPNHIFYVTPGINADKMIVKQGRLCTLDGPYPKIQDDMAPPSDNLNVARKIKDRIIFPLLYIGSGKDPLWVRPTFDPKSLQTAAPKPPTSGPRPKGSDANAGLMQLLGMDQN
jgi:hypothetical protein